MDPIEEFRFYSQVLGDAKRTIVCSPELESRVKCHLDALGIGGLVEVMVSPVCPDSELYLIDKAALEASSRQAMQRITRTWFA